MPANGFHIETIIEALSKQKKNVPILLANVARKYFVNTFKAQGFDGRPWKEVKRRQQGTPEYRWPQKPKASSRSSPILIRTGTLRREVNNSIRSATWDEIRLGVSDAAPYAEYINEGTGKMTKREFMGDSKQLHKQIKSTLQAEIRKVFKQ